MAVELTYKQQHFLEYIEEEISRRGRAPSLRQAARILGVSHAAVAQFLRALEKKGYLRRKGRYSRDLQLLRPSKYPIGEILSGRLVPVIGRIAAGLPLYAQEEWDGEILVDGSLFRGPRLFALRVTGDSMKDAGIFNDDLVICEARQYAKDGEIVVALIEGESATVKRFFQDGERIELRPENSGFSSMYYEFNEVLVQGKVVGLQRGPEGIH